jgi:hypothetical protein
LGADLLAQEPGPSCRRAGRSRRPQQGMAQADRGREAEMSFHPPPALRPPASSPRSITSSGVASSVDGTASQALWRLEVVGSFAGCCARAASGHATAVLPRRFTNSRRLMSARGLSPTRSLKRTLNVLRHGDQFLGRIVLPY